MFAGEMLSYAVKDLIRTERLVEEDLIVLGIPRGGIVVADILANKIGKDNFDIIFSRRITAPLNKEITIGSVFEDGSICINNDIKNHLKIQRKYIEEEKERQINEIKRLKSIYGHTSNQRLKDEKNVVLLVDDGAVTGATLLIACRWIKRQSNQKIIIALPIVPIDTVKTLSRECDHIAAIITPSTTSFNSVSQYYQDFNQVKDDQIIEIMDKSKNR